MESDDAPCLWKLQGKKRMKQRMDLFVERKESPGNHLTRFLPPLGIAGEKQDVCEVSCTVAVLVNSHVF